MHLTKTKLPTVSLPQFKISVEFPNKCVNELNLSTNPYSQINQDVIMFGVSGFLSLQISREEKYHFV